MNRLSFEGFQQLLSDEISCRSVLFREGRPYFVLQSQQFERRDLEALSYTATAMGTVTRLLTVPNHPNLEGLDLYVQALELDPNGIIFGLLDLSNGLRVRIGNSIPGCPSGS